MLVVIVLSLFIVTECQGYVVRCDDRKGIVPEGNKPQKPENGHCKVYNWQRMTCVWDLKVLYRHAKISAEWSVDWTVHQTWSACPNLSRNDTCLICKWKEGDGKDAYRRSTYMFRITVRSDERNVTETISEEVNSRAFVEPEKVQGLTISPNKTFIKLSWKHSNPIEDKRYRIQYSSEWTNFSEVKELNIDHNKVEEYTIRELTPYTVYKIKVDVIPIVNGSIMGYWSEAVRNTTKTLEDVPGKNPTMLPYFYQCADSECNNTTIYWQPTSIKDRHGVLTDYVIWIENMTDHTKSKLIMIKDTSSLRYNLHLNGKEKNNTYKILLHQRTKEGKAKQDSFFFILPKTTRPPQAKIIWVEANGTHVDIRWKNPSTMLIEWNGIVYCRGTYDLGCQDMIQTIIVRNTTSYSLDMGDDIEDYENYIFGVSTISHTTKSNALGAGKMTGSPINWNQCNYVLHGVPDEPLKIKRDNITDSNNFHIKWEPYDCNEAKGYVTEYIVTYCIQDTSTKCTYKNGKKINVTSTESSHTMENVEKGKTYFVWVQAHLHNLKKSPLQTDPLEMFIAKAPAQPLSEQNDNSLIYIVVGVVAGMVLLAVIITIIGYFVWKKCHVKQEDLAIDLPIVRKTSNSTDEGYDGSGGSKRLNDPDDNREENKPLLPKNPPPKKPGNSDNNDRSGFQGNGHIPEVNRDVSDDSYQLTNSGDVETYFKQAGSNVTENTDITCDRNVSGDTRSVNGNTTDKNKDFSRKPQGMFTHDMGDNSVDDTSAIDPYSKQTLDSSKNINIFMDISGGVNKKAPVPVSVDLIAGTALNADQGMLQDCSAQSIDSYVRNTLDSSDASVLNGYVRPEDANYSYESQGQVIVSGYNSDLFTSSGSMYNSGAGYTSGDSVDNYVLQHCDNEDLSNIQESSR